MSDDKKPTPADAAIAAIALFLMAFLGLGFLCLTIFAARCAWVMGGAV